ncbi:hypothetical protein [Pseudomonas sp. GXZC]|uniref:hypothetical protein n=1 Tax=Pseudomonas sp. GXZC TaxID=3003351 RepID=UPI0022AA393D|nr:hypothetical protein [Pseudomonas sp. GXZC]WAT32111.1 hypothetical protein OZ428_34180 [Pseudomonas sp. GXZC]
MSDLTEASSTNKLERAMREWISATTLSSNFLSKVKGIRDPALLLQFNALTNEPSEVAIAKIDEIVAGLDQ